MTERRAKPPRSYKDAGVDISAGRRGVELIKELAASTHRPEVLSSIGGFSGLFSFPSHQYKEPVLAAATDGVGTKLQYAISLDRHDTVGVDLVAMVVNDLVTSGAEPLFFLDYISCGKLVPGRVRDIVSGIAEGCRQAGCSLLGGETAEHPGVMPEDDYDLAGFGVGVVERRSVVEGGTLRPGDLVIGLPSSGLHSNGYSLVRAIIPPDDGQKLGSRLSGTGTTWGEALLTPTRIYVKAILALTRQVNVKAIAHITGGGLPENIERLLPSRVDVALDPQTWTLPPVIAELQSLASIPDQEMFGTFNMGLGMVIFVDEEDLERSLQILEKAGERSLVVGKVVTGTGRLRLEA